MALPKLPDNPTPEQLQRIALAVIRVTFENDADNIGEIEPFEDGGWKTTYEAGGQWFSLEYTPGDGFGKQPIGAA